MRKELVQLLRCPETRQPLSLEIERELHGRVFTGSLVSSDGRRCYPVEDYIPRFVAKQNYADNFGIQWNAFRRTQLDSFSGHSISSDRFWKASGWEPASMTGRWVLDVGCGAGRFAEIALEAGAKVVALDYSSAVDACYENLKHHPNLYVVQGDVYALPFAEEAFSFVYSLGVLQHTPDVAGAFSALPVVLAKGGCICVDFYERTWRRILLPKYWLRHLTKRMQKERLLSIVTKLAPSLFCLSRMLGNVPLLGIGLKRLVPVVNYVGILPLNDSQHREWSLLDTFDWYSPRYDNPQTESTVRRWLLDAGLDEIEILRVGHLVGRGTKSYDTGD